MIDYLVLIPTHNRLEKLSSLIDVLFSDSQDRRMLVCILNSGIVDPVDNMLLKLNNKNIIHLKLPDNFYWSMAISVGMKYIKRYDYKFQLWINDDVQLSNRSFTIVENDLSTFENSIYVGAFQDKNNHVSYGLKESGELLIPNGKLIKGSLMNGNFVAIPKKLVNEIGQMPTWLRHSIGDNLYGKKAKLLGYDLLLSSEYIGYCERHVLPEPWQNTKKPKLDRFKNLFEAKGLDYFRYARYLFLYDSKNILIRLLSPFFRILFR
jgi:GT2 family glycosyltransferase